MATSTTYDATYSGVVSGVTKSRSGYSAASVAATANLIALQIQTELGNPVISAKKQSLLTSIVAAYLADKYVAAALPAATITTLAAEYTTLVANLVD